MYCAVLLYALNSGAFAQVPLLDYKDKCFRLQSTSKRNPVAVYCIGELLVGKLRYRHPLLSWVNILVAKGKDL